MNTLSEEQLDAFNDYKKGDNIFLTGPGGCGKSYLLKSIINDARNNGKRISVCAMTGCAAVLLGEKAKTLHSWAGIGLGKGEFHILASRISTNKYKKAMWTKTEILIVDEVSMMSKNMFELLDYIGGHVRNDPRPFGGIQLIFSGDFYQLPPVNKANNDNDDSKFCFESRLWDSTFKHQILLDKVFRQSDKNYIDILNEVRDGELSKDSINTLETRLISNMGYKDGDIILHNETKPVKLMPIKTAVKNINDLEMNKIKEEPIIYKCEIKYTIPPNAESKSSFKKPTEKQIEHESSFIIKNALFDETLVLKLGCQVMCIANIDIDNGICNGSTGTIIDFNGKEKTPVVRFTNGSVRSIGKFDWNSDSIPGLVIKQIPFILAWAVTIHKSQGASLDCAEIDIGSKIFASGQTYVALSRVRSLDGLYLRSFNHNRINTEKKVRTFYDRFYEEVDEDEDEDEK